MHDLSARVTYGAPDEDLRFDGVKRSDWKTEPISNTTRAILNWKSLRDESPLLNLVPDEEIDLAVLHTVPSDAVCRVQVALIGMRQRSPVPAQWKCSTTSFPQKEGS